MIDDFHYKTKTSSFFACQPNLKWYLRNIQASYFNFTFDGFVRFAYKEFLVTQSFLPNSRQNTMV